MNSTSVLDNLVRLLALERIEENLFRGESQDLGWGTVFGGQVLGQALSAAVQTAPAERQVHSFHAFFLRPGDVSRPIVYDVDRIRDGNSFTTRRVVAIQHGHPIFNMQASFHAHEEGFVHQRAMPEAVPPDGLQNEGERMAKFAAKLPRGLGDKLSLARAFELRVIGEDDDPFAPTVRPPQRQVWLRASGVLADDPALHASLLAYVSDSCFVTTSLLPHAATWLTPGVQVASLDHTMWFHQPCRVDDWLLYDIDSPVAHGGRGLARGQIFDRDGRLVASVTQEGLIRKKTR